MRRNLLIVRAGDDSLHPGWLLPEGPRDFDLMVSYYGATPDRYREAVDVYETRIGPRWPGHAGIFRDNPGLVGAYDHIAFACDDLGADAPTWDALFDSCRRHALDLAQPAIEGPVSHVITAPDPGCVLRFTNFVEIMCPVMSRRALGLLAGTFGRSVSGWGLDMLWSTMLSGTDHRMAIIDSVRVRHTRPLREGTLYSLLAASGVDPLAEAHALMGEEYMARFEPVEVGRIEAKDGPLRQTEPQLAPAVGT